MARDPRVAEQLAEAIARLRAKPRGIGRGTATRALGLLGKCDSDPAREALRRLAADADADFRAAAVAALGSAGAAPDSALFARTLLEDAQPRARSEAAAAIAKLQARDALPALRRSLAEERNPEVTDAVVQALAALEALPDDPRQCFEATARSWEAHAAALAFACWRAQASREALLQAALEAPHVVRVLAMAALFERPPARDRPVVRFSQPPVPPPPAPPGARASIAVVPPPAATPAPAPPAFEDQTRRRLLDSAIQVLSRAARAYPAKPETVSPSLAYQLNSLLLDMAGGDMRLALQYADRIATRASRSVNDGSLAASYALYNRDARAYETLRRPKQALLAATLAACALLLLAFPQTRGAAVAAALPLAAWAVLTLNIGGVRELPPLSLAPLTIVGSASIVAAIIAAAALWRARRRAQGWTGALALGAGAIAAAALAAFFACGAARWYDVFPIASEGWELIFDPLGAAVAAAPLAALGFAGGAAIK